MLPVAVGLTKDSIQEEIPAMSDDGAADRESDTPGAEVDPENETAEPEPGNDVENAAANSAENQSAITTGERPTEQLACARPVQQSDEDYEFLQEQLRDREEELERVRREGQDMAVAEVIAHGNDENDSSTRNKPVSNPKTRWIIALAVVILVVVAILLGVLLPRRSSQTASNPTSSPTMSPTVSPLVSLTAILSDVSPDGGEALSTPSTPQNEALAWLAGNVNLDDYSEEQTIQRFVLATLYYSLNGDGWTNNDGWLSDDEECTWYNQADDGPFCMVGGGVRELDFFQNNLSGTIPAEVGLLSNSLVEFGLSDNVSGTLPTEIGQLTTLQSLWLYNINLTGTIPTEISLMTNLKVAWLFGNSFSGEFTCPDFITQCFVSCTGGDECRSL